MTPNQLRPEEIVMSTHTTGSEHPDDVARRLTAVISKVTGLTLDDLPFRLRAWDGSVAEPADATDETPTLVIASRNALTRLLWSPGELGLAQAYVTGEINVDGEREALADGFARLSAVARRPEVRLRLSPASIGAALRTARDLGIFGARPAPPDSQANLRGRRHSKHRDRSVIEHHYDLSNDFYAQILDDTMSYSCAYFGDPALGPDPSLEDAQRAKLDLICRKLELTEDARLLDVGCGWGATAVHAAEAYGARVTAVTISREQHAYIEKLVAEHGLQDRVTVLLQDYRDIVGRFDAVSSIEMGEHVGARNYPSFVKKLHESVRPGGRVLVQQMSRRGRRPGGGPFIEAFIAPDMHMRPLGETIGLFEDGGLEVVGVQSMRDNYARTVDHWIERFLAHSDEILALVGEEVFRVWHLYLIGGGMAFREGRMGVDQILAVKPGNTAATATVAGE